MQISNARAPQVRLTALLVVAGVMVALLPASAGLAAVDIGGTTTIEVPYTEQDTAIPIGASITVAGGNFYDGRYVEFSAQNSDGHEVLTLTNDEAPSTEAGVVSLVGTTVYLGDGTVAEAIGTIDGTLDGTAGKALRVNFSSPFTNASFETGDLTGWTAMNQWVDLGVTEIAGFVPTDTATYPLSSGGNDNDAPAVGSYDTSVNTSGGATHGTRALQLRSYGMSTANPCDVVHGPAVYSDLFPAASGDTIYFDWRAMFGGDAFHVFGYIVTEDGTHQTEVLDAYSTDSFNTDWAESATVIPADGNYRFVFVAGTFDASCGLAAGASLFIDNVRVFGGSKVGDAVVQDLARRLVYFNDSDDPAESQDVTVTAVASDDSVGTATVTVQIVPVDDAPSMTIVPGRTYTNIEAVQAFADHVFDVSAAVTDPDSDVFSFALAGSVAEVSTIDEMSYTHHLVGEYGTLYLDAASGDARYVPDSEAIDLQTTDDTETFTFTVTADGKSAANTYTVTIDAASTPAGAPTDLVGRAGNTLVDLSWTAPWWLGSAPVTGYMIEKSVDGGDTWEVVLADTGSDATAYTVEDLANGTEVTFRVSAINANGTGSASEPVAATPRAPAAAPACEYNQGSHTDEIAAWEVPCWQSPSTVDPASDAPGWMAEPSAFAIANGLIAPSADRRIAPLTKVSRAEVAVMLRTLAGNPQTGSLHPFHDTGSNSLEALNWLSSIGVVEGVGENRFAGDRTVTRAEAVALLWRLAGKPTVPNPHGFADVEDDWMQDAVSWAAANGIVVGRNASQFDPNAGVNRGELFAILLRWTKGIEESA